MEYKIYHKDDIYILDKQRGKGKIYEIINKSAPERIKKLFTKKTFAHAPSGTYYFYINNYESMQTDMYPSISLFLKFFEEITTLKENLLLTVQYEGPCSYIVAMPYENDDIRLVFLDRDDPKLRNWVDRTRDEDLSHTVAACDFIINKFDLIRQFSEELKRLYEENKYYISDEYKQRCKEEDIILYQEYILEDFEEYSEKFDDYLSATQPKETK